MELSYNLILASQSPRRQQLMGELGFPFRAAETLDIDESYPDTLPAESVAAYLAEVKAEGYAHILQSDKDLLITADTIVVVDGLVLGKPNGLEGAKKMLAQLSGKAHTVVTGVCLSSLEKRTVFESKTQVFFKELTPQEIDFYVEKYKPLDKAGAYGIQEWIGYIGIRRIEGSYFNVMGLPVQAMYEYLLSF